jgi:hypothetical protein
MLMRIKNPKGLLMRKIFFSFSILSTLLIVMSAYTINENSLSGVFKSNYIQSVTVPAGWNIKQGGFKGAEIEKAGVEGVSMRINTFQAETDMRFIENIIAQQVESYRKSASATLEVPISEKYQVDRKKHIAHIRHIYGAKEARYQAIAYIGEVGQMVTISLISNDNNQFRTSLSDFKTFVESYVVYSENEFTALNTQGSKSNTTLHQNAAANINNKTSRKTYY